MVAEIKTLKFYEGLEVSPPDQDQPITTGPSTLANHAIRKSEAEAYANGVANTAQANAIASSNGYTDTRITNLINGAPATLDTLKELADALGSDASFSATVATALGNRLRVDTNAQGLTGPQKTNAKTNIDLENVDNTSDSTKNSAVATLTNKTIDKLVSQETVDATTTGSNANITTATKTLHKLTSATLVSVDSIDAINSMLLVLQNKTGNSITINNNAGTAGKKILTGTGANLVLANDACIFLIYSPSTTIWQVVGGSGSGGSSASKVAFPVWKKLGLLSPISSIIDGMEIEDFSNLDSQEIYALIKVPESYTGGSLISLNGLSFFSSLITGNVFFKSQSSLLKSGSTVIGTYSNQRTSTNAQVAVNGVANTLTEVGALDLTDTTGKINGVSVAGGDKILIRLYRDIASETSGLAGDARLLLDSAEIKL